VIRHGVAPFLECSSRGDRRFSAFSARLRRYGGKAIEDIYQAAKIFEGGETRLTWQSAKGRRALNMEEVTALYSKLWDEYIEENPDLLPILKAATGLSDQFGQKGHCCQATELWRIRNASQS
jgi:hypothetical protein